MDFAPVRRGMLANNSGILKVKPGACRISRLATSFSTSAILRDTLSASLHTPVLITSAEQASLLTDTYSMLGASQLADRGGA